MDVGIQIICLLFSFFYGFLIRIVLYFHGHLFKGNKLLIYLIANFFVSFLLVLLYIVSIYKINYGIFHIYFIALIGIGYVVSKYVKIDKIKDILFFWHRK